MSDPWKLVRLVACLGLMLALLGAGVVAMRGKPPASYRMVIPFKSATVRMERRFDRVDPINVLRGWNSLWQMQAP